MATTRQLSVNLSFSADINQAKAQIQALQKALQDVAKMPGNASSLFDDIQIKKATQAATELHQHLSKAVNLDTGKLDLSRFSSSLKASNKDLNTYCDTLLSVGKEGQQAFLQLAQAIATADVPVTRVNKKLTEMGTVLRNTIRWQISSNVVHGFSGAVQSAYGYAQDLNKSLNDIRIVTGQNIDQMSKFAAEANKAARALSTTTTDYTNASLIYYQQGLTDAEVAERTAITVKMANAAGVSAQTVSDQLTAVWNNFDNGSKSLEYYADVMTALGAATASSTDEISEGLNKFAAVAGTVGLSYEYATAALATITSNTRESADVVGNALKTLFARIQGLQLGETLDDGTTLNKYSEALGKVGISIYDTSGKLKKMDNILDEMASKWNTLSKVQQVALAQTIAGVRQYNQLVALMENWNVGDADSMVANLNTAFSSSGVLQEQADIYAESWEAAQERVTAALEHIYKSLLNDEFFIDLLNGFEKVLETVGGVIDGFGGFKGIISVVSSVFLTAFAKEMPAALEDLRQNFMVFTGQSKKVMQEVQSELNLKLAEQQANPALSESYKIQLEGMSKVNSMKMKLVLASKELSNQEREEYETKIRNVQAMYEEAAALATKKKETDKLVNSLSKSTSATATKTSKGVFSTYNAQQKKLTAFEDKATDPSASTSSTKTYSKKADEVREQIAELDIQIDELKKLYDLSVDEVDALIDADSTSSVFQDAQRKISDKAKEIAASFVEQNKQYKNLEDISISVNEQAKAWQNVATEIRNAEAAGNTKNLSKYIDETKQKMQQYLTILQKIASDNGIKISASMIANMSDAIDGMDISNIEAVTQKFSNFARVISGKANMGILALDTSIEDLRSDMLTMNFNEEEINGLGRAADAAATATQDLANSMANIGTIADENVESSFKMSTALSELASSAISVSGLITTLQGAFSVFGDDGATGFEKIGAALSLVMPLLTTFNSLQALSTSLTKADFVTKILAAKGYQIVTTATGALAIAKTTEAAAVAASTAAWYANPVLWVAVVIVGIVAALAALVKIIGSVGQALADAYNKDAIAAENAENAAKNLSEAYNECKQEYEDMIAAMENYQSAREGLDELTKGTEAYKEALKEANRQALELINKYGLIEGQDYEWQGNELIIKDSAMNQARDKQAQEVDKLYAASQMADVEARRTRAIADQTELQRSIRDESGVGDGDKIISGIVNGLAAGLGLVTGGLGFLLTGAAIVNQGLKEKKSYEYDAAISKAIEESKTNANLFDTKSVMAETLDLDDEDIIDALWANRDSLEQLSTEMNTAAQAEKLAAQNAANEIMSDSGYDKTRSGQMALEAGGEIYQQIYDDAYDKYLADATDRGLFNEGTKASKAVFSEYAKEAGLDQLKNFEVTNYKGDGTVEYKYIDDEGQEKLVLATAEEIAATLAAADAASSLETALDGLKNTITDLNNSADLGDHAFAEFLSKGNLEGATKAEYENLYADVGASVDDAGNFTYDTTKLDSVLGLTGDAEADLALAASRGYASAEAYRQAFIDSLQIEWEVPAGIGQDITAALTVGAATKIQSAYENMGEQGGQAFVDTINTIASGIDWDTLTLEEQTAMLDEIANIDWTSWDAGKRAIAIAKEYGITIDATTQAWQDNINAMRDANDVLPDLAVMRQEFEQIKEVTEEIDIGSILSAEDYETLVNYNKELSKYFAILSDGSAQFIGDKLDFQEDLKAQQDQELLEALQLYKDRNEEISAEIEALQNDASRDNTIYNSKQASNLETLKAEAETNIGLIQSLMNEVALGAEDAGDRASLLKSGSINEEAYAHAVEAAHNAEKWEDMDPDEVQEYADALLEAADNSELLFDNMTEEAAEDVALYTKKMNQGVKKLADDFEDWSDILKKSDKSSEEYAGAMSDVKDAMSDVLGVSEEFLSDDFILENMEDIKKAAEGDAEAIDRLAIAASKDILIGVGFENENVKNEVLALHDQLVAEIPNIEVGATLNDGDFLNKAAQIIEAANLTAEQANAYFRSMGFEAKFKTEEKPVEQRVPITYTKSSIVDAGFDTATGAPYWTTATSSWQDGYDTFTGKMDVMAMSTDGSTPQIESLTKTNSGAMNNSSSSNTGGKSGGGGGGSKKKAEKPKKSNIVERYKEVNDLLDDVADAMEDASKAADRLYGKGRLDLMKKNNDLLKQEIELTKQKKEEALKYLDEDLDAMFKAASDAGVILTTDENGLITNYTEAMTELYEELNAEVTKANKDGNVSESEQARIDKIQERIDALKDAIDQYDETRELIEDLDNELDEKFYQWQDNNYEMLTYELEIKLELNEDELKLIDYYLNKISDDFYQMAEAAALMIGGDGVSQLEMYTSNLSNYEEHVTSLEEAYAKGEISQAAYVEGMREAQDGMLSNLESLNELDETMMHYYGETLAMAADEIAKYTDHMEHLTEVLDHYQSLMEIMGKSTDYEAMGIVLEGKAKALGDQAAAAKATMEMYKGEAEDRYQAYQQALLDGDAAAAELYLQQYEDALAAADEAEQEYLASAEEWAEALTAVLENKLSKFGQTLENALTGGTSFDQMTTAMERAASLQEEYLTTTNKIYETNKLMRQAQQEIDKTSNTAAKRRLQNFIEETNQLQNQAQLSNYELEIQQAKYDLLLAEIALEEAQNAKSIVRLQRDSEGNFGYVYTADGAAVSEAEQNMLDKQNNLYNIALQGANDYSQKYQQTLNEMYSTLTDLQQQYLEGAFESEEEYHAAVEAAKQYYYEKLQQYSSLHTVAITTDTRVINDAWSTGFSDMLTRTEEWMEAIDVYLADVDIAFTEWSEHMSQIAVDTGTDLDSLVDSVGSIVDESESLRETLIGEDGEGGVVGAIQTEIEAVKDITEEYATLRAELGRIKTAYEEVVAAIAATIRAQSQVSSNPGTSTTTYNPSSGGGQGSASDGADTRGSGSGGGGGGTSGSRTATDEGIRINLYAARNTAARMGSTVVKANSKGSITFGNYEYGAENDPSIKMIYASGAGWHGYVTASDRYAIKNAYKFDTGGYTGSWDGAYGKLAFLHQKELVLNEGDTENFLASMEILERILQVIDLHSANSQIGGILSSPILGNTGTQDVNQHISIEASFPNATDRFEIEEAFKSMANLASQYANRK